MKKVVSFLAAALMLMLVVTGCSEQDKSFKQVNKDAEKRKVYLPKNDVEFDNYNKAQKLYDSPDTIIWCSVMPQASTAPIITVPITGKLTSSSTSNFAPGGRSIDGMYHPNPPQYRYGFTPGDQYVDFFGLPTFCTTKPLDFQKDSVAVKVDSSLNAATQAAEAALAEGDHEKAQSILEEATNE